jgi:hypothetical protein
MPTEIKKLCFCCSKLLTARTRRTHRNKYLADLAAATGSATATLPADSDLDSDSHSLDLNALDDLLEGNVLDDDIKDLLATDPTALLAAATALANANNLVESAEEINREVEGN